MPSFDRTPDKPEAFGYKTFWFAIKTADPRSVVNKLECLEATPANWATGLAPTYYTRDANADPWVFVSPPVDGWVLAVSAWFPYPIAIEANRNIGEAFDALFSRLTKQFDEVQFFGSDRRVGFVTWARAVGGEPKRIFAMADGDVLANFGEQTLEEAQLGFPNLNGLSPEDARDRLFDLAEEEDIEESRLIASGLSHQEAQAAIRKKGRCPLPDEIDVIDLAALWSVDPIRLEDRDLAAGLGLAARLPVS